MTLNTFTSFIFLQFFKRYKSIRIKISDRNDSRYDVFTNSPHSLQVSLSEEQFLVDDRSQVIGVADLNTEAKDTAQKSLNNYVRLQGLAMSQVQYIYLFTQYTFISTH